MSRDPLEELFGPLDSGDADTGDAETTAIPAPNDADASAATRAFEAPVSPAEATPPQPVKRSSAWSMRRSAAQPTAPEVDNSDAPTAPFTPPADLADLAQTASAAAAAPTVPVAPAPAAPTSALPEAAPKAAPRSAAGPIRGRSTLEEVIAQGQARAENPRVAAPMPASKAIQEDKKGLGPMLPWIIVAAVVILAIIGSIIVIGATKGKDEPAPEPTTSTPAPTATTKPETTKPTEPVEEEEPVSDKAPKVEVGPNPISMDISYAGISVQSSQKLTDPQWQYIGGPPERVMFESGLMNSFPDSCAAMRSPSLQSPWGIERGEDGKWTVVRPAGTCQADEDLYNEVWGLMQAVADSAKPL